MAALTELATVAEPPAGFESRLIAALSPKTKPPASLPARPPRSRTRLALAGSTVAVGTFALENGNGYWAAAVPSSWSGITSAKLMSPSGQVLATADLSTASRRRASPVRRADARTGFSVRCREEPKPDESVDHGQRTRPRDVGTLATEPAL